MKSEAKFKSLSYKNLSVILNSNRRTISAWMCIHAANNLYKNLKKPSKCEQEHDFEHNKK